jgi:hypothetical protein
MTTEERLERLEVELATAKRSICRLIIGAGLVLGIFTLFVAVRAMTGIAYSQAEGNTAKVIRAKSFVVVDDQGRIRALLSVIKTGSGLALYDESGKVRARLDVNEDFPLLTLHDEKGTPRAVLDVTKYGPELSFHDEKGTPRASLDVLEDRPLLSLNNDKGKPIWSAPR